MFGPPPGASVQPALLPPETQTVARGNVLRVLCQLQRSGAKPFEFPYIIDCDSSPDRAQFKKDVSPCITCSRGRGHWVTNLKRRFTWAEMMRLQGMSPGLFKVVVSEAQLGIQIGNSMSVNVLERLFVRILPAARLVPHGALPDHWAGDNCLALCNLWKSARDAEPQEQ